MAENIQYLDDDNFDSTIAQGVTLVDFYADWCGPCRMMEPIIDELATEFQGKATIAKLDIEAAQQVTSKFNVTSIPTIVLFKDGNEERRIVGVKAIEDLRSILEEVM